MIDEHLMGYPSRYIHRGEEEIRIHYGDETINKIGDLNTFCFENGFIHRVNEEGDLLVFTSPWSPTRGNQEIKYAEVFKDTGHIHIPLQRRDDMPIRTLTDILQDIIKENPKYFNTPPKENMITFD